MKESLLTSPANEEANEDVERGVSNACALCTTTFTLTTRRHTCRACEKVVCGNCSRTRRKLKETDLFASRVCDTCKTGSSLEALAAAKCCSSLSYKQRVTGFAVCFIMGWVLSVCSSFSLIQVAKRGPGPFAVMYTLGNILSLFSTMFVWGPLKQCKNMCDKNHRVASSVYLGSIVATLAFALGTGSVVAVLLCMVVQLLAMVWYCASFFPGGRTMIKAGLTKCCPCL